MPAYRFSKIYKKLSIQYVEHYIFSILKNSKNKLNNQKYAINNNLSSNEKKKISGSKMYWYTCI